MEEVANTLDRSPVHDTATQKHKGQTTMKTQSSKGNLRLVNLTVRVGLWEEAGVWVTAHKKSYLSFVQQMSFLLSICITCQWE